MTKIIAVIGATGAQGGGLVRAIASDTSGAFKAPRHHLAIPDSDKAQGARQAGCGRSSPADVDDEASLRRAFDGAHGAFCVTFFWAHFSAGEGDGRGARSMAQAAKDAGVKHVIWSTLEDTRKLIPLSDDRMPTLQGKYKVPHFDAQGRSRRHASRELGVPTTFLADVVLLGELHLLRHGPEEGSGRQARADASDGQTRSCRASPSEDIGKCAYGIFRKGRESHRQDDSASRASISRGAQMASRTQPRARSDGRLRSLTPDQFRKLGFPAPTTSATCSSSTRTWRSCSAAPAAWSPRARAQSGAADLRPVARGEQGADSARLT